MREPGSFRKGESEAPADGMSRRRSVQAPDLLYIPPGDKDEGANYLAFHTALKKTAAKTSARESQPDLIKIYSLQDKVVTGTNTDGTDQAADSGGAAVKDKGWSSNNGANSKIALPLRR